MGCAVRAAAPKLAAVIGCACCAMSCAEAALVRAVLTILPCYHQQREVGVPCQLGCFRAPDVPDGALIAGIHRSSLPGQWEAAEMYVTGWRACGLAAAVFAQSLQHMAVVHGVLMFIHYISTQWSASDMVQC